MLAVGGVYEFEVFEYELFVLLFEGCFEVVGFDDFFVHFVALFVVGVVVDEPFFEVFILYFAQESFFLFDFSFFVVFFIFFVFALLMF